ncbi:hypothetical protein FALBO_43 [Fusarium albosuccineum]|uniref:Uncharacterized protein n=1 Tax=Fusarium albosuccineum TaxID=1237068 RepID=A0A8H4LRC6_9HYPO|nr:hypothetical protein FALBO_43 [Fusarium albosuccineum]
MNHGPYPQYSDQDATERPSSECIQKCFASAMSNFVPEVFPKCDCGSPVFPTKYFPADHVYAHPIFKLLPTEAAAQWHEALGTRAQLDHPPEPQIQPAVRRRADLIAALGVQMRAHLARTTTPTIVPASQPETPAAPAVVLATEPEPEPELAVNLPAPRGLMEAGSVS